MSEESAVTVQGKASPKIDDALDALDVDSHHAQRVREAVTDAETRVDVEDLTIMDWIETLCACDDVAIRIGGTSGHAYYLFWDEEGGDVVTARRGAASHRHNPTDTYVESLLQYYDPLPITESAALDAARGK